MGVAATCEETRVASGYRKMITVDCGMNGLLSGFHFEFSEGGRWARSRYTCSKAQFLSSNDI